jgi:hypothetical protein
MRRILPAAFLLLIFGCNAANEPAALEVELLSVQPAD